jgi:hypothetical protein
MTQTPNPHFLAFAAEVRRAADALRGAAAKARDLHLPEINFGRAIRLLESMAGYAERELMWRAFVKHNALTEAPSHPKNAARLRAGQVTSEVKAHAARQNARRGGQSKSQLKAAAARENGKLGGRPRKVPGAAPKSP